ncbi:MAG TPA: phasin family protein [Xanthobacteraceae bacterium]|nr:phasin family protein [Xanthobacteraceae bacterium]
MLKNFDDFQEISKDNVDIAMKQFGAVTIGMQAIATEVADYSKKSFENSRVAAEKLFAAKSLENAFEVQTEFVKGAYDGFVAQAAKFSTLYTDLAKDAYKPFESYFSNTTSAK